MEHEKAEEFILEKARQTGIPEEEWRAAYERLQRAETGMTAAEQEKVFCEAPTPGVVEDWVRQLRAEVQSGKPKTVGSAKGARV